MTEINWDEFEEVGVGETTTDRTWPAQGEVLEEGDSVLGRYIEKKTNVGKNKSNVYVLETISGEKIGVWGSTVIDSKFSNVALGKIVVCQYIGEKTSKKTGKDYRDFKVGQGIVVPGDEK